MTTTGPLDRRTFLKGLGTAIALPALDCMTPIASAAGKTKAPLRMAFIYGPNGVNVDKWRPNGSGKDYTLSPTLEPMKALKPHFQVLSGLDHDKAHANGDGGGDHARANSTFLTGVQIRKTAGADIKAGVSVDQLAAEQIGHQTYLRSLELSCDEARGSGSCDSGYSCAYQYNLAWRSENQPMAPEANPRLVFERLFGSKDTSGTKEERKKRAAQKKSILDFVLDDAKRLQRQVGASDRRKLDEYFTAVREMEVRIEKAEEHSRKMPDAEAPTGIPSSYRDHIRMLYDLMAIAFETDTTRISTFMMAHDGSNRSFPDIGVPDGHHHISHHRRDAEKLEKIARIDRFYVEQYAYFIDKLRKTKDVDGKSILENSMILYGCGISDGDRHNHNDLPVLLAGHGTGKLKPGRHVEYRGDIPMTNLYLSMLDRMGVKAERLGDSDGRVADI